MIRRPPRSTQSRSSAASDVYKRQQSLTPQGTAYEPLGAASQGTNEVREINQEWTLGFEKGFGKLNVNAFVGGNKMTSKNQQVSANGSTFNIPFFASVNNTSFQN